MKKRYHIGYIIFALYAVFLINGLLLNQAEVGRIPYSQFQTLLRENRLQRIVVEQNYISGELKEPRPDEKKRFVTVRIDPQLHELLAAHDVEVQGKVNDGFFSQVIGWVLPALIFIGLWLLVIRMVGNKAGMGGGAFMAVGKSKAKIYVETDIKVTFNDVAGVDEAKDELKEIVSFLKDPGDYTRLGARLPKGILLVGPPGTGKTLLARAVAGEAKVAFFSISGSEFVEMFVGVGAARVRDLFEQARKKAPCIVFIDELDALGRSRQGKMPGGGNDEKEQTLNQLLVELDGFDTKSGIVLLAATNRPEILDPALLRSGRFDRQVLVDRPDKTGRIAILDVHMKQIQFLADDVDVGTLASLTVGFSGADLANLVNEAALVATRRRGEQVNQQDFTQAIERIVAGLEKKNRILNPKEKQRIAWHEMGHAIVAASLPGSDTVHKISIIPRGVGALGYTMQRPSEDRFIMTERDLKNRIAILLGGRASELFKFKDLSSGAADDLAKATDIAKDMVMRYGMDPELGSVAWQAHGEQSYLNPTFQGPEFSPDTAGKIDAAVQGLLHAGLEQASQILRSRQPLLEDSVAQLLNQETLTAEEFQVLLHRYPENEKI